MLRRKFISDAVRLAVVASASSLSFGKLSFAAPLAQKPDDLIKHILADIIYLLIPHKQVDQSPYYEAAGSLMQMMKASADIEELVNNGIMELEKKAGTGWLKLSADQKIKALEKSERNPFFGFIMHQSLGSIYRNPVVWKSIGYEGSSLEHGGYLHRGFNDIDWLPEN